MCRKSWKKLKANLTGMSLSCAIGDATIVSCGPPTLGLQLEEDPWARQRPYQEGKSRPSSTETHPGTPIDPAELVSDPPLGSPSITSEVLTDQEMYDIAAADSTLDLGEEDNPIVIN